MSFSDSLMSLQDQYDLVIQLSGREPLAEDDKLLLDCLHAIAVALRDEHERKRAPSSLATSLVDLMRTGTWMIIEACARVAANLAADNGERLPMSCTESDTGRTELVNAGYLESTLHLLSSVSETHERTLLASLLNMSVDRHEPTCRLLAQHLPIFFEVLERQRNGPWVWEILAATAEQDPNMFCISYRLEYSARFAEALKLSDEDTIANACGILERLCESDAPPAGLPIEAMIDFIEHATGLGISKASLINALVAVSPAVMQLDIMWQTMERWLVAREDQVACALLCLGNAVNDTIALRIVDTLLPQVLLVDASIPTVQHAMIGLLRNLSVPIATRITMGSAGVMERLVDMGVWKEDRDILGSVQGGAVVLIKNLCREAPNASRFVDIPDGIEQLLLLHARSDDRALRLEIARLFSNIVRHRNDRMQDERILDSLVEMLRAGEEFPILLHEAVVAIAVLAAFEPRIRPVLLGKLLVETDGDAPLVQLARLAESGDKAELRENVHTLLANLDPVIVKSAIDAARQLNA
ncbi:hypothetical protein BCR39DRAFT_519645 [Naematelia encephala]|uniref:Armadillo-type protein n=1 Tax=Naematelia encephala TaxID=71784 RepID=A0A1Y2BEW4_9TREE|nr:hypothetical protein BCR39DRAFT_519645 [Naematelia encephala]